MKARALLDMEAAAEALAVLRAAEAAGVEYIDPTLHGRALEGAGFTDLARAKYA